MTELSLRQSGRRKGDILGRKGNVLRETKMARSLNNRSLASRTTGRAGGSLQPPALQPTDDDDDDNDVDDDDDDDDGVV